jgi:hypothetical protein
MIIFTILLLCICIVSAQENSFQSVQLAAQLARRIVSDAGRHDITWL